MLFEERCGRALCDRVVEAARACGRADDLAILDLSPDRPPQASVRHAVGLDVSRGIARDDIPDFVADLSIPVERRDAEPATRETVRAMVAGMLDGAGMPAPSLGEIAARACGSREGTDPEAVRLAFARIQLHLHRHAWCLSGGAGSPERALDIEAVASGRTVLLVRHGARPGSDLLSALVGAVARAAQRVLTRDPPLVVVRHPRRDPREPVWLATLEAMPGYRPARHAEATWVVEPGRAPPAPGLGVATPSPPAFVSEGRVTAATSGDGSVLAVVADGTAHLCHRERDGWILQASLRRSDERPLRNPAVRDLAESVLRGRCDLGQEKGRITDGAGVGWTFVPGCRVLGAGRLAGASSRIVSAFASTLDLDLRDACLQSGYGAALHAWTRHPAGNMRARSDFVRVWRSLAGIAWRPGIAGAVDSGAETLRLVAGSLGIGIGKARRIRGRERLPAGWMEEIERGGRTPPMLVEIDVNRLPPPGDPGEWSAFVHCADLVDAFRSRLAHAHDASLVGLLTGLGETWSARRAALDWEADAAEDAADMVRALARNLGLASGRDQPDACEEAALALLSRGRTLSDLLALSRTWHSDPVISRRGAFRDGLPSDAEGWPPLFAGSVRLPGGIVAIALRTVGDLRREGCHGPDPDGIPGLDHCVEGYAHACVMGRSHIVSLRRPDGTRLSTVELVPTEAGRLAPAQHRGPRNAPPTAEAELACSRLLEALGDGLVDISPEAVRLRPVPKGWGTGSMPDPVAEHGRWRPFLPRRIAGRPLHQIVMALGGSVRG